MERILPESLRRQTIAYAIQLGNLRWVVTGLLMAVIIGTWTHIVFTPLSHQLAHTQEETPTTHSKQSGDAQYTAYLKSSCDSFNHAIDRHRNDQPYTTFIALAQKHNLELVACNPIESQNEKIISPYQQAQHQFCCRGSYENIIACVQELYEQHHELKASLQALELSPHNDLDTRIIVQSITVPHIPKNEVAS